MNSDDAAKTVNIRVSASTWDNLSDENRSEICREALRTASQMKIDAGKAMRYANEYEASLEELDKAQANVDVKKQMLVNELESYNYDELILADDLPDPFSVFEETLFYSAKYTRTYLKSGRDHQWVINAIIQEMRDEGKMLPIGIAEWIVETVDDDIDYDDEDSS